MAEIMTVGRDLARNVFQVHGAHGAGRAVLRKKPQRKQVLEFLSRLLSWFTAMETFGGVHLLGVNHLVLRIAS